MKNIDKIKGKLEVNKASRSEIKQFLDYVSKLENPLDEGDEMDYTPFMEKI